MALEDNLLEVVNFSAMSGNGTSLVVGATVNHTSIVAARYFRNVPNADQSIYYDGVLDYSFITEGNIPTITTGTALSGRWVGYFDTQLGTGSFFEWENITSSEQMLSLSFFPGDDKIHGNGWIGTSASSNLTTWEGNYVDLLVTTSGSGGTTKLYINGALQTTTGTAGASPTATTGELSMMRNRAGVNYMRGEAAEVSLWNRELSQAEVTELYNSGRYKTYKADTNTFTEPTILTNLRTARVLGATVAQTGDDAPSGGVFQYGGTLTAITAGVPAPWTYAWEWTSGLGARHNEFTNNRTSTDTYVNSIANNDWTWRCHAYIDSSGNGYYFDGQGSAEFLTLQTATGGTVVNIKDGTTNQDIASYITFDEWNDIMVRRKPGTMELWVDGALANTYVPTDLISGTTSSFTLFNHTGFGSAGPSAMTEFEFWGRYLSDAEMGAVSGSSFDGSGFPSPGGQPVDTRGLNIDIYQRIHRGKRF